MKLKCLDGVEISPTFAGVTLAYLEDCFVMKLL